ncbi:MAG: TylF/MycF family methyltransferase [Spirochaetaceae bacterium]|jgi:O-methyltransferase|nr:TylF/MycF family methyltransferase [Spirochaetaceae bacterium]
MLYAVVRIIREVVIAWAIQVFTRSDVVRYRTLAAAAAEIKIRNLEGAVAELGVYKGDFASRINRRFPHRTLYLFDTFDGFDKRDVEVENSFDHNAKPNDFTNKDVNLVLRKMRHPEMCVVRKGWFPESALGVEDRFVFVSIDADLYEPIYQGLLFFYPRLERGGYIFVHDYNGGVYDGAIKAVRRFAEEFKAAYVPVSDLCGSVVFSK